jgi:hypothetical protein
MLTRCVFNVWGAWLGALGLAAALTASGIWNANPIFGVALSVLMLSGLLGFVVAATVRLIRGLGRDRALAGLLVGTAPFWLLAGHILMAIRPAFTLLRSGPFARVWNRLRHRFNDSEGAILAHPDHSLLDVEECRFGPIPEAEFALEAFLASLGPGRPGRQPAVEPSTATPLDWYWLAFVGGGISLVGGSGLALGSRYRDRQAVRVD